MKAGDISSTKSLLKDFKWLIVTKFTYEDLQMFLYDP